MFKNTIKNILLSGAGFTHNFGGFLAEEMWAEIFNHPKIQTHSSIREMMLDDFDYESIYYRIISEEDKDSEKNAISEAILDAYKNLDDIVSNWKFRDDSPYPINNSKLNDLIERFAGTKGEPGIIFTLNQDLFIERKFTGSKAMLELPGVKRIPDPGLNREMPLEAKDYISLPNKEELESKKENYLKSGNLYYIKLHGSFNWKSHDGSLRLVIGLDKEKLIGREPLLNWYFDIFRRVLSQREIKLLIIGYGFRDEHINEVIATGIKMNGLKLYILSPENPKIFKERVFKLPHGEQLLKGLYGYFPYNLLRVFPKDQSDSHAYKTIRKYYLYGK